MNYKKLLGEVLTLKETLEHYEQLLLASSSFSFEEKKELKRQKELAVDIQEEILRKELEYKEQNSFSENELPIDPIDFKDRINDPRITEAILDYNLQLEIETLNPFDLERKIIRRINDDNDIIKLPFKGNCNINMSFNWAYTETFRTRKEVEDMFKEINKATYEAFFSCEVDDDGEISIIPKETETKYIEKDNPIYCINDITSGVNGNTLNLSFDFGRNPNKKNSLLDSAKNFIDYSFSKEFKIGIQLSKIDVERTTELIFESENQAILSSDQQQVCKDWWNQLNGKLKEDIRNKKVKIVIRGFTSPPGTKDYNIELGLKRAQNVAKMLTPIIGTNVKGEPVCQFECRTKGEETNDPRRYVKIRTVRL